MVDGLIEYARTENGHDSSVRYELAERKIESQVEQMLNYQVIGVQMRGMVPSNEASIAKLYSTELDQRIAATGMKMLGLYGQLKRGSERAKLEGGMAAMLMYATTSTIGGGTSEVQRNIIAQRGLGLPRG
jgi:alkylation response protein AidB-like acyl-CoA dehydrogenase